METDIPHIGVVIVTWNNEKDIVECLESILNQTYKNFNVLVVDNYSTDNTKKLISEKFPTVTVLPQNENKYLPKSNNIGINYFIKNYESEYILVLNPDTKSENNLLEELSQQMSINEKIGAVGPKVKFYKSKNEGLINSAGMFYDGYIQAYDIGFMETDEGQFDEVKEVFGVTGACILYRVKMLNEIGLYWEKIKLHLDEVELFIRARKHGWKVIYTPKTTLWHSYMQSTDQNKLYRIDQAKRKVWFWIAMRHFSLKSKLAIIRQYLLRTD
jgi:GT2 family glycosyltransferase